MTSASERLGTFVAGFLISGAQATGVSEERREAGSTSCSSKSHARLFGWLADLFSLATGLAAGRPLVPDRCLVECRGDSHTGRHRTSQHTLLCCCCFWLQCPPPTDLGGVVDDCKSCDQLLSTTACHWAAFCEIEHVRVTMIGTQ